MKVSPLLPIKKKGYLCPKKGVQANKEHTRETKEQNEMQSNFP